MRTKTQNINSVHLAMQNCTPVLYSTSLHSILEHLIQGYGLDVQYIPIQSVQGSTYTIRMCVCVSKSYELYLTYLY